jgi:hypothetical protein
MFLCELASSSTEFLSFFLFFCSRTVPFVPLVCVSITSRLPPQVSFCWPLRIARICRWTPLVSTRLSFVRLFVCLHWNFLFCQLHSILDIAVAIDMNAFYVNSTTAFSTFNLSSSVCSAVRKRKA